MLIPVSGDNVLGLGENSAAAGRWAAGWSPSSVPASGTGNHFTADAAREQTVRHGKLLYTSTRVTKK